MTSALKIRAASKFYSSNFENVKILSNFNLTASQGSIFCLIGPSGAGKTTLFNCILGITSLDSGEISIFGHDTQKSLALAKNPKALGYMPQDASLVEELTVKENLKFFSNLYEMDEKYFKSRFELLKMALELPEDNIKVENCSGGEKRRISLAIAILCEPALLLLDEPTVGVDPILREKIWKFLHHAVKSTNMTVILTTHYINEAEQSDRVGMLRNGRLLIEDSPKNILAKFETERIDEVFAILCKEKVNSGIEKNEEEIVDKNYKPAVNFEKSPKTLSTQIVKAFVMKELLVLKRQPSLFGLILVLPILALIIVGQMFDYPIGMPFGIINNEVDCSTVNSNFYTSNCIKENFSCLREKKIAKIKNLKIVFYKNFDEAFKDGKSGKLYGFIRFRKNFTKTLDLRTKGANKVNANEDLYIVDFYADKTNLHLDQFILLELWKSIQSFAFEIGSSCNISMKYIETVLTDVKFEKPIFGSTEIDFLNEIFAAYFLGVNFMLSFTFCCLSILHDLKNGSWNREVLSGVSLFEIVTGHFVVQLIIMIIELCGFYFIIALTMDLKNTGLFALELLLTVMVYISGTFFGIIFSCIFESYTLSVFVSIGSSMIQIFLSGSFWPFEGMHWTIRPLSWTLPAVLPGKALKNMIIKDYRNHSTIFIGFLVPTLWIFICAIGLIFVFKNKRVFN